MLFFYYQYELFHCRPAKASSVSTSFLWPTSRSDGFRRRRSRSTCLWSSGSGREGCRCSAVENAIWGLGIDFATNVSVQVIGLRHKPVFRPHAHKNLVLIFPEAPIFIFVKIRTCTNLNISEKHLWKDIHASRNIVDFKFMDKHILFQFDYPLLGNWNKSQHTSFRSQCFEWPTRMLKFPAKG